MGCMYLMRACCYTTTLPSHPHPRYLRNTAQTRVKQASRPWQTSVSFLSSRAKISTAAAGSSCVSRFCVSMLAPSKARFLTCTDCTSHANHYARRANTGKCEWFFKQQNVCATHRNVSRLLHTQLADSKQRPQPYQPSKRDRKSTRLN